MKNSIVVYSLPNDEALAERLAQTLDASVGKLTVHEFPDGETYVRGETRCDGLDAIIAVDLFHPNPTVLPLIFCVHAIRDLGARSVILVAPYLPYMRQDKRFKKGEVVTSRIFAEYLSNTVDGVVTIDPHLHRYSTLDEIYSVPSSVQHAAPSISAWIKSNVKNPVIVGPDGESEQWVSAVAEKANAPFIVLTKTRHGDRDVEITVPPLEPWREHTPVLVDDIISTAHTMIETIGHLNKAGYSAPVCIGVHGVFAGSAYEDIKKSGALKVVTSNTILHLSNVIDLTNTLAEGVHQLLANNPEFHTDVESRHKHTDYERST